MQVHSLPGGSKGWHSCRGLLSVHISILLRHMDTCARAHGHLSPWAHAGGEGPHVLQATELTHTDPHRSNSFVLLLHEGFIS